MKNILLATTALAMTVGYAAADVSYSASAKLAYGNFGTGNFTNNGTTAAPNTASTYGYTNEFDFVVTGSGEAGGVSYSASMAIDESTASSSAANAANAGGSNALGAFSMSAGGFTYAYDANDFGGLVDTGADGEDDDAGDWKLSYAANGISASYEADEAVAGRHEVILGYTANNLTVGYQAEDADGSAGNAAVNTVSIGYTMGAIAVSYAADDKPAATGRNDAGSDYDAKITYTMGDTVLSAGTDEVSAHYAGIATTIGGLTLTMRTEQDGKKCVGTCGTVAAGEVLSAAENELSISYVMGALTVGYSKDTGNKGNYGDEAETVTTLTYDLGGVTLVAKGTDRDETEVSAAFSF